MIISKQLFGGVSFTDGFTDLQRFTRWIKEAIHIRKEGQQAMNRDEGSYQLSHAYDRFLSITGRIECHCSFF